MDGRNKKCLFLVDDGWRYEKREMVSYLAEHLDIDIATHDRLTSETLQHDERLPVTTLPVFPLRYGLRYCLTYLFARELDTHLCRMVHRLRFRRYSLPKKAIALLRLLLGKLGLRRYEWIDALKGLYQGSAKYRDLLSRYDAICFSPVSMKDKRIIFEAQQMGLKTVCWVFSWDNPFKDSEFIRDADCYLVWNRENAEALAQWHGIPTTRCRIVGPVQFDYLHTPRSPRPPAAPYILYACTMGEPEYVEQELAIIHLLRKMMDRACPTVDLHIRPYPFRGAEKAYESLHEHQGITLLSYGRRFVEGKMLIDAPDIEDKFAQMQGALAMITLGSTIALEAALTDTVVLQVVFSPPSSVPEAWRLEHIWKNDHLPCVLDYDLPNVVRKEEELSRVLGQIAAGETGPLREYSECLRRLVDPLGAGSYKDVFLDVLRKELAS